MDPEKLFLANLSLIDQVIEGVCRRGRLHGADAEDFASAARLALMENDYAVLRRFEGRAALSTYLTIVIERLLADARTHERGRWHASAEATQLGAAGVLLETLVRRDRRTFDEALPLVQRAHPELTRADLESMLERLPQRRARPVTVEAGEELEDLIAREVTDAPLLAAEARQLAERASRVVRETLAGYDAEDRALLRLRFVGAQSIADIARMTRLPQRPLYRRFEDLLGRLRRALRLAGVSDRNAEDVIATAGVVDLDLGLEINGDRQSNPDEGPATAKERV